MPGRLTRETIHVRLAERRIAEIHELVASWPQETKAFMRARLNQYRPSSGLLNNILESVLSFVMDSPDKSFNVLKDPDILTDWQRRFALSGERTPQEAWNKILEKEVSAKDYQYLLALLDKELVDVHVPVEIRELFAKVYRAHLRKEYISDPTVPKAPLMLFVGPSGSGKTSTVSQAIEVLIFGRDVQAEIDLEQKREDLLADEPFWKTIEEIDPTLAMEIARRKKIKNYKRMAKIPLVRWLFKKRIGQTLATLQEQGIWVDYSVITPNDYQTALAGEPGNYFKRALGDARRTSIRHVEEAHSAFGKATGRDSGLAGQQRTLIDTSNIILDEIITGKRDCLLIATTDQPERFDAAIYRRFVEKGVIINISDYWANPENLREVVRLELRRNDIHLGVPDGAEEEGEGRWVSEEEMTETVDKLYVLFRERTLKVIPSYVRKLVHSIIEINNHFSPRHLDDPMLVRRAFELVAQNSYGDLYKKVVGHMDRDIKWESYAGSIKDTFSEMANNCLYYNVNEEKGVVLNGPPGSGKTFLVRTWLSENSDIHDIATSASVLQDPANPVEGIADNLEKVYDIAKMIAPTMVFFDEGDALAPRRSDTGGHPSDKVTNKFLNLIDGETPMHKVFTVLTTNRLDILDPALIRSKRLKVLEIKGMLKNVDIVQIVDSALVGIPLSPGVTAADIVEAAKGVCNTPADYAAFVEKARSLRNTEFEVAMLLRRIRHGSRKAKENFIKFNFKTLMGILEAVGGDNPLKGMTNPTPERFHDHYDEILELITAISSSDQYPLMPSHLKSARSEIAGSPTKKGKVELDEFLETELSQEPQIGFIIGVGANDVTGVLLPIATSLTYGLSAEKVMVTGAVSSSSAGAQMEMAVQMTQQSAHEALTMVENYLQEMEPKVSAARLLGEFLDKYTFHHQLLSASYNVGGPSAGYALAINTLSALMNIPVYHDFGITGAPWTKGVKRGEVGGSVIIGGQRRKTEKVLMHLRRMYMPLKNYQGLEREFLANYWTQDKDVLGVTHFGDLVPEVIYLDSEHDQALKKLIDLRIRYKLDKYHHSQRPNEEMKAEILHHKEILRHRAEREIRSRLAALRRYLRSPERDPHLSLEEIFRQEGYSLARVADPLRSLVERFRSLRKSWAE